MGRVKKRWVDKSKDVTYSLVYRAAQEATEDNAEDRIMVPKGQGQYAAPTRRPMPPSYGRRAGGEFDDDLESWDGEEGEEGYWEEEDEEEGPSHAPEPSDEWEAKRREIIALGFPDDGYDYLKHLRVLGSGTTSLQAVGGPSRGMHPTDREQFSLKPAPEVEAEEGDEAAVLELEAEEVLQVAPDVRIFDARQLRVEREAADDEDAAGRVGGVSAFARPLEAEVEEVRRRHRDLREVDEVMAKLDEDVELAPEDLGLEALLDDFVLEATRENEERTRQLIADYERRAQQEDDEEEDYEEEEEDEDEEDWRRHSGLGAAPRAIPLDARSHASFVQHYQTGRSRVVVRDADGRSVASQWNRAERADRTDAQTIIDEKFERLALEYDDEELGDLEEEAEEARAGGISSQMLDKVMDDFIKKYPKPAHMDEDGEEVEGQRLGGVVVGKRSLSLQLEEDDEDAVIARERAREAYRRALGAIPEGEEVDAALEAEDDRKRETEMIREERQREQWDCESVLSLRSNLENHPGRIAEPSNPKKKKSAAASEAGSVRVGLAAAGLIQLSSKTGIPVGYAGAPSKRGGGYGALEGAGSESESDSEEDGQAPGGPRKKGETKEEKKARKAAVKDARRQARESKKEVKAVFKETVNKLSKTQPSKPVSIVKL